MEEARRLVMPKAGGKWSRAISERSSHHIGWPLRESEDGFQRGFRCHRWARDAEHVSRRNGKSDARRQGRRLDDGLSRKQAGAGAREKALASELGRSPSRKRGAELIAFAKRRIAREPDTTIEALAKCRRFSKARAGHGRGNSSPNQRRTRRRLVLHRRLWPRNPNARAHSSSFATQAGVEGPNLMGERPIRREKKKGARASRMTRRIYNLVE